MQAWEFQSALNANQTITVPPNVAGRIPQGVPVRVLVLVGEGEADKEWEELAALEFGQGYSDGDAIYDDLPER
jgi:hypothetical protein